jgi:hypothetical protein
VFAAAGLGQKERLTAMIAKEPELAVHRSNWGVTPMHCAAQHGRIEAAKELLAHRADVNAADNIRWTPLHSAAFEGQLETSKLLIERGANVNATNSYGLTPLHHAAMKLHKEIAELLLAHGADVNAAEWGHQTPLFHAKHLSMGMPFGEDRALAMKRREEFIELLMRHGAKDELNRRAPGGPFGPPPNSIRQE